MKRKKSKINITTHDLKLIYAFLFVIIAHSSGFLILRYILLIIAFLVSSESIFKAYYKDIKKKDYLSENFLMISASVASFFLKYYEEAVLIIIFFSVAESLEDRLVENSKEKIDFLSKFRVDNVKQYIDGKIEIIDVKDCKVGDIIRVYVGEKVGIDGVLITENCLIDRSALNGEEEPLSILKNEKIFATDIIISRDILVKVTKTFEQSIFVQMSDIAKDINKNDSDFQRFLIKYTRRLIPVVILSSFFIAFILPLIMEGNYFRQSLFVLVAACPCAIIISVPLAYFISSYIALNENILVKNADAFDKCINLKNFIFDKTNVLTLNYYIISSILNYNKDSINYTSMIDSYLNTETATLFMKDFVKFNDKVYKILNRYEDRDKLDEFPYVNKKDFSLHLMNDGNIVCSFNLQKPARKHCKKLIDLLHKKNKKTFILSGDTNYNTRNLADEIKVDGYYSQLSPVDKLNCIRNFSEEGICYIGDGYNDILAMKFADLSISSSMVAENAIIDNSDIVFTSDDIVKSLIRLINLSYRLRNVVVFNIYFALLVKFITITMSFLFNINTYWAIFSDLGVSIICILNLERLKKI